MLKATDLKNGVMFLSYGKPYQIIKYALIKMGRGSATVKVTARNLESGSVEEKSYGSSATIEDMVARKRSLQYLYKDAKSVVFMDPASFEQIEIPATVLGDQIKFLKEGENATILFWTTSEGVDKPLAIDLPPKISLTVTDTDPGVKGNSASNMYKSATLENGFQTKVPLFINIGDKIRVDTRSGEYVERSKE